MTINALLEKIRSNIERLTVEEQQHAQDFLIHIIKKVHDEGFKNFTADEFELVNITLDANIKNTKIKLFTDALKSVTRELAKRNEDGSNPHKKPSDAWLSFGSEIALEALRDVFTDAANKKLKENTETLQPVTEPAREIVSAEPPPTPRQPKNHPTTNPSTTIVTTAATSSAHKIITNQMIFDNLWGNENKDIPQPESVCGKMHATWDKKSTSPTMLSPLPTFEFKKPALKDVTINGEDIEMKLTMTHQSKDKINLTLSRQIDDTKNEETWRCQSDSILISEKMQFEFIAAESLALRKAQGIKDAEKIGIMDIGENDSDKKLSAKFKEIPLTIREEALIEAHVNAGYTEITYGPHVITSTPASTAAPTALTH